MNRTLNILVSITLPVPYSSSETPEARKRLGELTVGAVAKSLPFHVARVDLISVLAVEPAPIEGAEPPVAGGAR